MSVDVHWCFGGITTIGWETSKSPQAPLCPSLCVCAHMWVCMYVCACMCAHVCVRVYVCACMCAVASQSAERCPNLPKCPCALPCVCVRVCVCVRTPMLRAQHALYPPSNTALLSSGTLHGSCLELTHPAYQTLFLLKFPISNFPGPCHHNHISISKNPAFLDTQLYGITQQFLLQWWPASLNIMSSRFLHGIENGRFPFLKTE